MPVYEDLKKKGTSEIVYPNIKTPNIPDSGVTTAKIADNAVTSAKVANNAIDTAHINGEAVTTAKIDDEAITTAKIASQAVTTAKLGYEAVTEIKIASNSVGNSKLHMANSSLSSYLSGESTIAGVYTKLKALLNQPWITFKASYANGAGIINILVYDLAGVYKVYYNGLTSLSVVALETDTDAVNFVTNVAPDIYYFYMV